MSAPTTLVVLIGVSLLFDFANGFHDAANSVATIISTRVMKPGWAVFWTALFNFIAFLVFPLSVARTVGSGIVDPQVVDDTFIASALAGAIGWDLLTWWWGLPSSSSHALVGGLVGAGAAKAGFGVINLSGLLPTVAFMVLSPLIGLLLAGTLLVALTWALRKIKRPKLDHWFRRLQFVSAASLSLGHGGNDAQKTMGIIMALLIAHGVEDAKAEIPLWVVLSCHTAMGLGTVSGGWRIVKTMGSRLTELHPFQGFCAETGGALSLFFATMLGIPVSTTHVITGGIVGVGAAERVGAVRWRVALRVVWAWLFTIQAAAAISALTFWILHGLSRS